MGTVEIIVAAFFVIAGPPVGTYIGLSVAVWANNRLIQLHQVGAPLRSTIPYHCAICAAFVAALAGNVLCVHGTTMIALARHRAGVFANETLLHFAPALALLLFSVSAYFLGQQARRGTVQHGKVLVTWWFGALAYIVLASIMLWHDLWL